MYRERFCAVCTPWRARCHLCAEDHAKNSDLALRQMHVIRSGITCFGKMSAELMLRILSASVAASRNAARIIRQITQGGDLKIKDKVRCSHKHE